MPLGFHTNIEEQTVANPYFRQVIYTTPRKITAGLQITVMSLNPHEDIGWERHDHVTQFLRIESGNGIAVLQSDRQESVYPLSNGSIIVIPAGTVHNIFNTSTTEPMK